MKVRRVASMVALLVAAASALAQSTDALRAGFESPPASARPRVWWHWMNGNITQAGIQADLEWMSRAGIGGFQNFDGGTSAIPRIVSPVVYESPEWKSAFRFAMSTAARLGLEGARASSPGWSETGGPWVKPEQAMKKYVWSLTTVTGGRRFQGVLPAPPSATGAFKDYPAGEAGVGGKVLPEYYADARVFAYRLPSGTRGQLALAPKITASALGTATDTTPVSLPVWVVGMPAPAPATTSQSAPPAAPDQIANGPGAELDIKRLSDGSLLDPVILARASNAKPTWIRFAYSRPTTILGLTIATGGMQQPFTAGHAFPDYGDPDSGPRLRVEASDDNQTWRVVTESYYNGAQRTISFPATTAKYFRVVLLEIAPPQVRRGGPTSYVPGVSLSELVLHDVGTIQRFEAKAYFSQVNDYFAIPTGPVPADRVVGRSDVVDLTARMRPDGRLDWTPPRGNWVIVRLGYSLTGHQNGPAPDEATGLEVDKLNARHVSRYMDTYLGMLVEAAGKENTGARGLQYILNDSYEAGFQNWTEDILEQFKARRGYDPFPWLPTLTGVVVGSATDSERFLFDWRTTINQLLAEAHYKVITEKAHAAGMRTYQEALEDRRAYFGDDMQMRQYADVPMAAMWSFGPDAGPRMSFQADNRGAASVANIYGKPFVAAESFTGGSYPTNPKTLKHVADVELVNGINRFVVHTSAHQPLDQGPGMSLMGIGVFFSRNETWAEQARGWTTYLSRASFLLQQGRAATDVAYFYGQEAPITGIWAWEYQKDAPEGYDYDYVNADVILNQLSLGDHGHLVTASGMRYRVLALGERAHQITLPVLRRLRDFVQGGAVIVGAKPTQSPSLADDDAEFQRIATALWGDGAAGEHLFGAGRVFVGRSINQALESVGLGKDFDYTKPRADTLIWNKHRRLADGDLYFVVNRNNRAQDVEVSLRVSGKRVELWDAVSGRIRAATYRTENGRTLVPLRLGALDSVFVVLRAEGPAAFSMPAVTEAALGEIPGPWKIEFQPDRGAPASADFASLTSWTDSTDPAVKFFSGVGTYRKTIDAPAAWFTAGAEQWLDLGDVRELAEVSINGRDLGVVWRVPYEVNVTGALKPGSNEIVIKVANTWVNRLVGDKQSGVAKPIAFSLTNPYSASTALPPSGLLGPVRLKQRRDVQ